MQKSHTKSGNVEEILFLFFEAGRAIRQACFAPSGALLSLVHLETLRFVSEHQEPTMRDVSDYLRVTAPSATALIEELAAKGYLVRRQDKADRRLVRLSISSKGKSFLAKVMKKRLKAMQSMVAPLTLSDRKEFIRILSILVTK